MLAVSDREEEWTVDYCWTNDSLLGLEPRVAHFQTNAFQHVPFPSIFRYLHGKSVVYLLRYYSALDQISVYYY